MRRRWRTEGQWRSEGDAPHIQIINCFIVQLDQTREDFNIFPPRWEEFNNSHPTIWTSLVGSFRIPQSSDILSPLGLASGLYVASVRGLFTLSTMCTVCSHCTQCAQFVYIVRNVRGLFTLHTMRVVCSRIICKQPTGWTPCSQLPDYTAVYPAYTVYHTSHCCCSTENCSAL